MDKQLDKQTVFFQKLRNIKAGKVAAIIPKPPADLGQPVGLKGLAMGLSFEEIEKQLVVDYIVKPAPKKPKSAKTTSELVADAPSTVVPKVKKSNQESSIFMPPAPFEQWKVQVYPDLNNVIHFQAKTSPLQAIYYKWYVAAKDEVYVAVQNAYGAGKDFRTSFYPGSDKQYLVCARVGETTVDIPGYGTFEVPELFNPQ